MRDEATAAAALVRLSRGLTDDVDATEALNRYTLSRESSGLGLAPHVSIDADDLHALLADALTLRQLTTGGL